MKNTLLILSDIYGLEGQDWMEYYKRGLASEFNLYLFDSCTLAGLPKTTTAIEERHDRLIHGGISKAVHKLFQKAPPEALILGFSVGGTIAWKAALQGLKNRGLILISATRLRYEESLPPTPIDLYYGEKDPYRPQASWFQKMTLKPHLLPRKDHEFYRRKNEAEFLMSTLLNQKRS